MSEDRKDRIDEILSKQHTAINRDLEGRVLTYVKTYRVTTHLSDAEIIAYAKSSKIRDIDSLVDALDLMAELHEMFGDDADNEVHVEVHSSQVDERDPGLF